MKGCIGFLMVIAAMCPLCFRAWGTSAVPELPTLESLVERMELMGAFAAEVRYEVSLPMVDDDVVYSLALASDTVSADPLSEMDYLIQWSLKRDGDASTGFLAYFDGHHYRFRDNRLLEYHYEWDSIPFNAVDGGVQRCGQFVELLPQSVAKELKRMVASEDFEVGYEPAAVDGGRDVSVVMATQTVKGFVGRNYRLIADRATGRPLRIINEFNPGQISEQTVTAVYSYPSDGAALRAVSSEAELMAMYPDVFERFRESNYRIENLRGLKLPSFSLPTVTGERYSWQRGDGFMRPTVIALIDPSVASAGATVEALRCAGKQTPRDVGLVLAFTGSDVALVETLVGGPSDAGEVDLLSARSLARDCGTSVFPTILVVSPSGTVTNVLLGFNNSLSEDVIQAVALIE